MKQTVYSSNVALRQPITETEKNELNWQRKDRPDGYTEFRNAKGEVVAVFNTIYLSN